MTKTHTPPPNWTYDTHCLHCKRNYITQYRYDYGYCSDQCEKEDEWREEA